MIASTFECSLLALQLFVNNKFIELKPGGYFVCTRPDLTSWIPSGQTPLHLRAHDQVVEFSHAALPLRWTSPSRLWTSVMSVEQQRFAGSSCAHCFTSTIS
jgi:hypothetical protein